MKLEKKLLYSSYRRPRIKRVAENRYDPKIRLAFSDPREWSEELKLLPSFGALTFLEVVRSSLRTSSLLALFTIRMVVAVHR